MAYTLNSNTLAEERAPRNKHSAGCARGRVGSFVILGTEGNATPARSGICVIQQAGAVPVFMLNPNAVLDAQQIELVQEQPMLS